jgi:hypothetical protein
MDTRSSARYVDRLHRPTASAFVTLVLALVTAASSALAQPDPAAADDVLIRLGDETVTREHFDQQFEVAARATAAQEGLEPTAEVLARYDAFKPEFLQQLAEQLVLVAHARDVDVAASDAEVDAVVAELRAAQGDEDDFAAYLTSAGFGTEVELRVTIERSLNAQRAVDVLASEIDVTRADVETWYDANPEQVTTPDGVLPLELVEAEIAQLLIQEGVQRRVDELVASSGVEVRADLL